MTNNWEYRYIKISQTGVIVNSQAMSNSIVNVNNISVIEELESETDPGANVVVMLYPT